MRHGVRGWLHASKQVFTLILGFEQCSQLLRLMSDACFQYAQSSVSGGSVLMMDAIYFTFKCAPILQPQPHCSPVVPMG